LKGGNFLSSRGIKQSNTSPFLFTKVIALNCNSEAASCAETVTCSGFQPGGVLFDSSSMNLNLGVPGKIMISELLIL
jgi:hypothetical protein